MIFLPASAITSERILQLPHYYTQAQSALKLSKLNENCRTYPYNDIAIFDLFDTLASQTNLLEFCEEKLMDLLAYDKAHGDNLLKTLQVYLETCLQYEETARQLLSIKIPSAIVLQMSEIFEYRFHGR